MARALYPLDVVRFLIYAMLVAGFGLGTLSVLLRRSKVLGFSALALATAGTLLGGSTTEVGTLGGTTGYVGLDWFLLNLLVLGAGLRAARARVRAAARAADLPPRLDAPTSRTSR